MLSDLTTEEKHIFKINNRGRSSFLEVMDKFMALIVIVSWVHIYLQTHQVLNIKYVQRFV